MNTLQKNKSDFYYGVLFSLINSFSLGTLGIIDKLGSSHFTNPFIFSTQSVFYGLVFATLFAFIYRRNKLFDDIKQLSTSSWKLIFLVGIFASGLFILLRFLGLTQSTGTFATLSQIITTAITAVFALIFLKERLSKQFWVFFIIILIATYFVSVGKFTLSDIQIGDAYIILGTLFLAAGNIFSKLALKHASPITLSVGRFFFGGLFLLLIGATAFNYNDLVYSFSYWSILSGLFWTINIIAFNFAIKRISITLATSLLVTAPVYTMVLEYVLLKHIFTPIQVIAAFVVVVSGILLVITKNK